MQSTNTFPDIRWKMFSLTRTPTPAPTEESLRMTFMTSFQPLPTPYFQIISWSRSSIRTITITTNPSSIIKKSVFSITTPYSL